MNFTKNFTFLFLIIFSTHLFAAEKSLKIYAAASLSNVLQEINKEFKSSRKIVFNFDASSKLAKQIAFGAPADLFFSADAAWMVYLEKAGKIDTSSRVNLVSNQMVLIVPIDSIKVPVHSKDLLDNFYHHIALAGEAVPAGKFARAALKTEGVLTDAFKKKIVNADNVRVALRWVASHEAAAGVVYATDVLIEPKVKIAFSFKDDSYPKIIYPAAVVSKSKMALDAQKFIAFCKTQRAQDIFAKAGFINL